MDYKEKYNLQNHQDNPQNREHTINGEYVDNNILNSLEELDLQKYWYIIKNNYWIILTTFLVIVISTLIYTFRQTPQYRATSTIIIEPDIQQAVNFNDFTQIRYTEEFFETQLKIINSRSVVKKTADILGLQSEDSTKDVISELIGRITIEPEENTQLVLLSVDNPNPEKAMKEVNTLANVYIYHNLEDRRVASRDAFTWLSEQLAILKSKVKQSEMELLKYKEKEDIVTLDRKQKLFEEKISETNESYNKAISKRIELETIIEEIEDLKQTDLIGSLPRIIENPLVQQLKQEQSKLEIELAKISKKYKPKHPKIIMLQSQIDNIDERLTIEVEKIIKSIEVETRISKSNENIIKKNLDGLKHESMRLAKQAIQYGVLKREATSNRELYEVLLHRMKETDISGNTNANNIRVVDKAILPKEPISPKKPRDILIAVIIGLVLGISICIFLDYFDNTIKKEEDIKAYFHETSLGSIPIGKDFSINGNNELNLINRSYREIKTTLNFYRKEHILNSILITSATPGEGKTTSVQFIGSTFAQTGSKTLIIDADLYNPKLAGLFNINSKLGLSDYFTNNNDVNEIIVETETENLSIIPSGLIPNNPSEIIGSRKMKELIDIVKNDFDIVIIDSPPVSAALEVAILGGYVDGIGFIVKANSITWQVINKSINKINLLKGKIIGVILTSVKHSDKSSYNYYYSKEHV